MRLPIDFAAVRTLQSQRSAGESVETLQFRVDTLVEVVFALLVEVEALRNMHAEPSVPEAASTPRLGPSYARSYRDTALLTHNSAGVTTGMDKIILRFFGTHSPGSNDDNLRECLMLRRIGYTDDEIQEYLADVEHVSQLT